MSKTYRRTKRKHPRWVVYSYFYYDILREKELKGKERKEAIAKYHSDSADIQGSAPSWFVTMFFSKKDRAKERKELKRILMSTDYEDYSFQPYKHGAMWEWW